MDVLRIISAIAVIVLHVAGRYSNIETLKTYSELDYYGAVLCRVVSRFSVPIFFMISGMLLLSDESDSSIRIILKKRVPRILLPLLFWSVFYALINEGVISVYENSASVYVVLYEILYIISSISKGHLWFLFVLTTLYLYIPILKQILKSRRITIYMLGILFFVSFCKLIFDFVRLENVENSLLLSIGHGLGQIIIKILFIASKLFTNFISQFSLDIFSVNKGTGFLPVAILCFVLGYVLNKQNFSIKHRWGVYIAGFLSLILITTMTLFHISHKLPENFWHYGLPAIIYAVAVFVIIKR